MDPSACGRPEAALTVHRTVIHPRPLNPFHHLTKQQPFVVFFLPKFAQKVQGQAKYAQKAHMTNAFLY
jgi:hypothetical protein